MAKNIVVVDRQGNVYEATYPKRARGLVKKGRACFVNASTICLACPPFHMEDDKMNTTDTDNRQAIKEPKAFHTPSQLDASYIVQKIDQILADSSYLVTALKQLENLDEAGAMALGNMVEHRENTNQRMIGFLEKLLEKMDF